MRKIYFVICLLLFSCDSSRIFEKNTQISDEVWDIDERPKFEVDIQDTVTPHNFYFNIRHYSVYPYSNIYVFIYTTFPNNKLAKDTLECVLADNAGKWLGKGMGDIWDNQFLFKAGKRFPIKGKYTFEIEQAMRAEHLPYVMDVGLRIEKAKQQ